MEIDVTSLLALDQFALSHPQAEGGENAGPETWKAAQDQAAETPLLDTPEKLQAMRDFARSSGGWDGEEIAAWSDREINALFLQWIAGDCRECPATHGERADSLEDIDWGEYEEQASAGQISSNLFRGDDGKIYFTLDS